MIESGVDGITVLGLATEVQKLSFEEQRILIDWVSEVAVWVCALSVTIYMSPHDVILSAT